MTGIYPCKSAYGGEPHGETFHGLRHPHIIMLEKRQMHQTLMAVSV